MLIVIFKATLSSALMDSSSPEFKRYLKMASKLREKALCQYQCIEFTSTTEGDQEIALSYWQDIEAIKAWKSDKLHQQAQRMGHNKWYKEYCIEIVEVLKNYRKS